MNEDDFTEEMIIELRSCAECSLYFGNKYMEYGSAEQQFVLHDSVFNSMQTNVVIYPTITGGRESLLSCMAAFEEMPPYLKMDIAFQTTTEAWFENGSQLIFKTGRIKGLVDMHISNLLLAVDLTMTEHEQLRPFIMHKRALGTKVHYF
jgi:hypothetical protein